MRTVRTGRAPDRRVRCLAALATVAASCGGEPPRDGFALRPPAEQPGGAVSLAFAWPVPAEARVRERIRRAGLELEVGYRLRIEAAGGELQVRTDRVELADPGGRPASTDAERASRAAVVESIEAAMPAIRVGREGRYLGVVDLDGWAERLAASLEAQLGAGVPAEAERGLRARIETIRSQAVRPALERSAGERWDAWVGCWIGLGAAPGATVARRTVATLPWAPFGAEVELPARIAGYVVRPPTHVRVEMVGDLEPRAGGAAGALAGLLARVVEPGLEGLTARFGRAAVVDPATLQPVFAEARLRLSRATSDGPVGSEEVRIWEFDWGVPPPAK